MLSRHGLDQFKSTSVVAISENSLEESNLTCKEHSHPYTQRFYTAEYTSIAQLRLPAEATTNSGHSGGPGKSEQNPQEELESVCKVATAQLSEGAVSLIRRNVRTVLNKLNRGRLCGRYWEVTN